MRHARYGDLDVVLTGGTDREGGGEGPLVVLMHGFGAPGDDLVGLYRVLDLPRDIRFAFPAAPHALPGMVGGRMWWQIDMAAVERAMMSGKPRDPTGEHPEGLVDANAQLSRALEELQEDLGVSDAQTVIGGFSQGSMLACDLTLVGERDFAGLAILSGTLLGASRWVPKMAERTRVPVFQSHGQLDGVLGFEYAERLRDELVGAGASVDFVAFRGGHEIPMAVLRGFEAFVRRALDV